jgi:hypothetical protein
MIAPTELHALWRAYTLEAGRNLFGAWVVEISVTVV